jgi:hypothetical protein
MPAPAARNCWPRSGPPAVALVGKQPGHRPHISTPAGVHGMTTGFRPARAIRWWAGQCGHVQAISAWWGELWLACCRQPFPAGFPFTTGNSRFPQISPSVISEGERCALPAADTPPRKDP